MDRAFQRIRSLMLRGTFYSVPPTLFIIDKFAGAKHLVDEMTIVE